MPHETYILDVLFVLACNLLITTHKPINYRSELRVNPSKTATKTKTFQLLYLTVAVTIMMTMNPDMNTRFNPLVQIIALTWVGLFFSITKHIYLFDPLVEQLHYWLVESSWNVRVFVRPVKCTNHLCTLFHAGLGIKLHEPRLLSYAFES